MDLLNAIRKSVAVFLICCAFLFAITANGDWGGGRLELTIFAIVAAFILFYQASLSKKNKRSKNKAEENKNSEIDIKKIKAELRDEIIEELQSRKGSDFN